MTPEFMMNVGSLLVGAVCAYFGAVNAMRERLARLEARADANERSAQAAYEHSQNAHQRIDSVLERH